MIPFSILALLYFLPTIIAGRKGHNIVGTLLLNLFFGWTVIGWFALLLWALLSWPQYYFPAANYSPNYWRR